MVTTAAARDKRGKLFRRSLLRNSCRQRLARMPRTAKWGCNDEDERWEMSTAGVEQGKALPFKNFLRLRPSLLTPTFFASLDGVVVH